MQPNSDNQRQISVPSRNQAIPSRSNDRDIAAALMKEQIDRLYDDSSSGHSTNENIASPTPANPYTQSSHNETPHANASWEKYHTAWQQYYQQYYHRYYMAQQKRQNESSTPQLGIVSSAPQSQSVSKDEAIDEIRNDLIGKVKGHSASIRKSRHFVPVISAALVMAVFLFFQYNRIMVGQVKAYVTPSTLTPEKVLIGTISDVAVSKEPRMIIPKINVDAPVVYGLDSLAEGPVQEALKDGIIHYPIPGASAVPGQKGNSVFLGHSSNDVFDDGDYKFVFVQLDKLVVGDTFHINYKGTRFTYSVTSKEVILPTEVNKLVINEDKPTVTLVTCTPIGTAEKRLLIHAEQISPDPLSASEASPNTAPTEPAVITGNSPTLFERLFGS